MTRLPLPEEILGDATGPLLALDLECNRCRHTTSAEFEYVMIDPSSPPGADGVLVSRLFTCGECGAVDDYQVSPQDQIRLLKEARGARNHVRGRLIVGVCRLWDGSPAIRPTQSLERLRELTRTHPDKTQAWDRLGNSCQRYGLLKEAEAAWRKAIQHDRTNFGAHWSLADLLTQQKRWKQAFGFICEAIRLLPGTKELAAGDRRRFARGLVIRLADFTETTTKPLSFGAVWSGERPGVLHASTIDLHQVPEWEPLADFLVSDDLVAVDIRQLPSDDVSTQLERKLFGTAPRDPSDEARPSREQRTGTPRNAPCPCGSHKKYKKCHGQNATP